MSKAKLEGSFCYYSVLGIRKQATASEIREAYRRLALKWHPDRLMKDPKVAGEANKMFQKIQEAYSVLSNRKKRTIYDAGLLGFLDDDDDQGFCDFMQELALLMQNERSQEKLFLKDLQELLGDMTAESERAVSLPSASKRIRTYR